MCAHALCALFALMTLHGAARIWVQRVQSQETIEGQSVIKDGFAHTDLLVEQVCSEMTSSDNAVVPQPQAGMSEGAVTLSKISSMAWVCCNRDSHREHETM